MMYILPFCDNVTSSMSLLISLVVNDICLQMFRLTLCSDQLWSEREDQPASPRPTSHPTCVRCFSVRFESVSTRSVSSVAPSPRTPLSPHSPPAAGEERFYNPLHAAANHTSSKTTQHILENFRNSYASYSDGH